jgi:oligoribonuclease
MNEPTRQTPNLVWMDLEMTGLEPDTDNIIEIASIVTDGDLNIIAEGPELVINVPESRFSQMDSWNREHHSSSGLWEKVLASKITLADAEALTLDFLKKHVGYKTSPLAGSSIWQDRRFITKYMKQIDSYLHYRMVDVSSFKEMIKRWHPDYPIKLEKKNTHRALEDIRESINELKFYRDHFFALAQK